jgi:hypothetical protein
VALAWTSSPASPPPPPQIIGLLVVLLPHSVLCLPAALALGCLGLLCRCLGLALGLRLLLPPSWPAAVAVWVADEGSGDVWKRQPLTGRAPMRAPPRQRRLSLQQPGPRYHAPPQRAFTAARHGLPQSMHRLSQSFTAQHSLGSPDVAPPPRLPFMSLSSGSDRRATLSSFVGVLTSLRKGSPGYVC